MRVELGRVLAEVPDVAAGVLAVPVGRALLEPAAEVEAVADGDAGNAHDFLRETGDDNHVPRPLTVLRPRVDVARPGAEREPRVVDAGTEARRRRHRRSPCFLP